MRKNQIDIINACLAEIKVVADVYEANARHFEKLGAPTKYTEEYIQYKVSHYFELEKNREKVS